MNGKKRNFLYLETTCSNICKDGELQMISKSVIGITKSSLKVYCNLSISSTVPRNEERNNKSQGVNRFLKKRDFFNNSRFVKTRKHLNNSKPHLNNKG